VVLLTILNLKNQAEESKMDAGLSAIYKREENKKLLFVYAMAQRDMRLAKIYLDKIQNSKDMYERDSIIVTLYIIYGRIFSKNFDLPKLDIQKLGCKLNDDELSLHKSLINSRNKIFAHSDASMNNIQICLNDKEELVAVYSHNTTLIEKHHDVTTKLFEKILASVGEKVNKLLHELYAQENGYKVTKKRFALLGYSNNFWERHIDSEQK
jgi:hypothetical protein